MKSTLVVAACLLAAPAIAIQGSEPADRCGKIDVMMGAYEKKPARPERSPGAILSPKPENEGTGPAVLIPNCRGEIKKRRRKNDYPLA